MIAIIGEHHTVIRASLTILFFIIWSFSGVKIQKILNTYLFFMKKFQFYTLF